MIKKYVDLIVASVAGLIAVVLIGLFTKVYVVTGEHGIYGGWGFEIFIVVFAVVYLAISGIRRIFRKFR